MLHHDLRSAPPYLRPLKKKGFKEERVTTMGLYDIGKSHDPGIQQEPLPQWRRYTVEKHLVTEITSWHALVLYGWVELRPRAA